MLGIYCASLIPAGTEVDDETLSEYRRERLKKTADEHVRRQGLTAELLLNHAAAEFDTALLPPLDVVLSERGKPELRGREFFLSLSHSYERVLCAVSDCIVGADIQKQEPGKAVIAERFFTPYEQGLVRSAPDVDYEFTRLWCMKESYIKATGNGLATPLNSFSVTDGRISGLSGCERYKLWHTAADGYHIAVCYCSQIDGEICIREIKLP